VGRQRRQERSRWVILTLWIFIPRRLTTKLSTIISQVPLLKPKPIGLSLGVSAKVVRLRLGFFRIGMFGILILIIRVLRFLIRKTTIRTKLSRLFLRVAPLRLRLTTTTRKSPFEGTFFVQPHLALTLIFKVNPQAPSASRR
jgi:hypothetical protein